MAGTNGKTVLNGTVDPTGGVGTDGDFYINTTSDFIFGPKAAGAWGAGTSLVGPQGPAGGGSGWLLTGNAAINPATNFLGTTDAQPLNFRMNNIGSGTINNVTRNTALGSFTLNASPTGNWNSAFGYEALRFLTTGEFNAALGARALKANTTGNDNSAVGVESMTANTTGFRNAALGAASLYSNTTGRYNTAAGVYALFQNSTGHSNVAIGIAALRLNNNRSNIVAVGDSALFNNSVGAGPVDDIDNPGQATGNVAVGSKALFANTTGQGNTAVGSRALDANTDGDRNTAVGNGALGGSTLGNECTAVGFDAQGNTFGEFNTSVGYRAIPGGLGSYNTAVGHRAGQVFTTTTYSAALGHQALGVVTAGGSNTGVGSFAGPNLSTASNTTSLGYQATCTAGNMVRVGNSSVTSIGGYAGWTNISDARVKDDVRTDVPGLAFINQLRPVTYHLNVDRIASHLNEDTQADKHGNRVPSTASPEEIEARAEKAALRYTGFIAQEVDAAAKATGFDFSGIDRAGGGDDLIGLRYAEFVVPLVKAVQEQQAQLDEQRKEIEALRALVKKLMER